MKQIDKRTNRQMIRAKYRDCRNDHWLTSLKNELFFCVGEYAEYGFDQQRLIWYVCRLWDMVRS